MRNLSKRARRVFAASLLVGFVTVVGTHAAPAQPPPNPSQGIIQRILVWLFTKVGEPGG